MATKHNYFYILDKTKYITYEELLSRETEEIRENLLLTIDKNKPIEYSFSLYCYLYKRIDQGNICRAHINFTLDRSNIKFDPSGNPFGMKYQRCIFSSEHSHQLQKGDFLPH